MTREEKRIWEEMLDLMDALPDNDATTTPAFWECECDGLVSSLRPRQHNRCLVCGADRDDSPDARLSVVLGALITEAITQDGRLKRSLGDGHETKNAEHLDCGDQNLQANEERRTAMPPKNETTVMITVPGGVRGHVVRTWMNDKELALVNKAVEFLERVDNDDRLRVGIYWPREFEVTSESGVQPTINTYDAELFVYVDHVTFGYTCDGPKESAHLHIDGLRRLFA